eukprot:TRINITY_DN11423_c0_g1_i1.p1 TRINITY_DN11423_c0_g1~~TRINITY_DN11423_c0_g1_i1.p1  ORF type:complete len:406 (+),score=93.17 TRINITY_DN11423_c0_g1_i1:127-1344(+)
MIRRIVKEGYRFKRCNKKTEKGKLNENGKENEFKFNGIINWFPGHMHKAKKEIQKKLEDVNLLIEVRDARLPISSMNNDLNRFLKAENNQVEKIVVLNKSDLITDHKIKKKIKKRIFEEDSSCKEIVFTTAIRLNSNHLLTKALDILLPNSDTNKNYVKNNKKLKIMVIGLPNVGKSTLLNALIDNNRGYDIVTKHIKKKFKEGNKDKDKNNDNKNENNINLLNSAFSSVSNNNDIQSSIFLQHQEKILKSYNKPTKQISSKAKAKIGPKPGVTRHVNDNYVLSHSPSIVLVDSPGVMIPRFSEEERSQGLKLTLVGCFKDSLIGETVIADFLLFTLNKLNLLDYIKVLKLTEQVNDINILLKHIATKVINSKTSNNQPDLQKSSLYFIKLFREGKLGKYLLDEL